MEVPWEAPAWAGVGSMGAVCVPAVLWPNCISSLSGLSHFSLNGVFLKVPVHKCCFPLGTLGLPTLPQSLHSEKQELEDVGQWRTVQRDSSLSLSH